MTNELEKQFFDTFGIEQRQRKACVDKNVLCPTPKVDCDDCFYFQYVPEYPYISNRALLELICMANQHEDYPISTNIKNIQARTLRILLRTEKFYKNYYGNDKRYKKLVKQVRTLFEEG